MRLNNFEIENIKKQAIRHFGNEVKVILFGSRTQNEKRGGDIDLYIKSTDLETMNPRSKINFITDLLMIIGEQKKNGYPSIEIRSPKDLIDYEND
ncbi:MAG: nucleotidyltransferase domain-containing protein [Bacteroidota bacterium]